MKKLFYILALVFSSAAYAGMPMAARLTDIFSYRLQSISLFIVILILMTLLFNFIWNHFSKKFEKIPKLSLKQAGAFIFLLALLFNIVLVMISGARELLTPGAWNKAGNVYELK